jgi:uncharacterized integral membrane protein
VSLLHRTVRDGNGQPPPEDVGTSAAAEQLTAPQPAQPAAVSVSSGRVPRTRAGAAWVALIAAALLAVLLIVFLVQNTHSTQISFLWMTANTPMAVALLVAAVGSVLLTLIVGTARISQLRRLVRKNRTQ